MMDPINASAKADRAWIVAVLLLGFPSVLFVVARLVVAADSLPETIGLVLAWTLAVTGSVGPLLTLAALAVTIAATFQRRIAVPIRVGLWAIALLSALACLYMSRVPS
jgi:hypothetical protein